MKNNSIEQLSLILISILCFVGCQNNTDNNSKSAKTIGTKNSGTNSVEKNKTEEKYDLSFFSGKAEVNTYNLKKARYNDFHSGESVLIFVTEPFLKGEQVKSDHPNNENSVSVLKMNRIDRFSTGIYDYSIYTSVFTPISDYQPSYPLKITMSSQDWCGQSFMQLNNRGGFEVLLRSYFESEGDTINYLDYSFTEDNLFNLARIDTMLLPTGEFEIIPTMAHLRLSHEPLKAYKANATLSKLENQVIYSYDIPELKRGVRIFMDQKNHFQIVRWEETYPTVFDGKIRKSVYTLKSSKRLPYWELNQAGDAFMRDSLKLD